MSKAWLIGGASLLGILLVASIVIALTKKEATLPGGTPQAVVQSFLKGIVDEDYSQAYSLLSEELKKDCNLQDLAQGDFPGDKGLKDDRVTLERTRQVENNAFVTVRVTQFQGSGPFGPSESSFEQVFTLRQEQGQWKIVEYGWPYNRCISPKPQPAFIIVPTPEPVSPTPTAAPGR